MNLLRSKGYSSKTSPPTRNIRHSPLDIPEVLERIFSFLDNHTLVSTATLVCSEWYDVSRRFISLAVDLDASLGNRKVDLVLADILAARRLVLGASKDNSGQVFEQVERLRPLLLEKSQLRPQEGIRSMTSLVAPLQELVLWRGYRETSTVLSLLPFSNVLTGLHIHNDWRHNFRFDLALILQAYPNLISLHLSTSVSGEFIILDSGSTLDGEDEMARSMNPRNPGILTQLRLESINFHGLAIAQATLQNLLMACSGTLKHLRLWRLQTGFGSWTNSSVEGTTPDFDLRDFAQLLTMSLSLSLESFTMSVRGKQESALLDRLLEENEIIQCFGGQSKVQTWGFSLGFMSALARADPCCWMTTLELTRNDSDGFFSTVGTEGLHLVLCRSPFLKHLYARDVYFSVAHFELFYSSQERVKGVPPWIWACTGLETLWLTVTNPTQYWTLSAQNCRLALGYLVRVCPRLKELELGQLRRMELGWDAGWALLSRLEFLERVTLWPSVKMGRKKAMEGLWAMIRPGPLQKLHQRIVLNKQGFKMHSEEEMVEFLRRRDVFRVEEETEASRCDPKKPWMDLRYLGMIWDIKMAVGDMEKDPEMKRCWPRLERVRVRYHEFDAYHEYDARGVDERRIESRVPFRYTDQTRIINVPSL